MAAEPRRDRARQRSYPAAASVRSRGPAFPRARASELSYGARAREERHLGMRDIADLPDDAASPSPRSSRSSPRSTPAPGVQKPTATVRAVAGLGKRRLSYREIVGLHEAAGGETDWEAVHARAAARLGKRRLSIRDMAGMHGASDAGRGLEVVCSCAAAGRRKRRLSYREIVGRHEGADRVTDWEAVYARAASRKKKRRVSVREMAELHGTADRDSRHLICSASPLPVQVAPEPAPVTGWQLALAVGAALPVAPLSAARSQRRSFLGDELARLEARLVPEHGWPVPFARFAVSEFVRCLEIQGRAEDATKLAMPRALELVWRESVLDAEAYPKLCVHLLGEQAYVYPCGENASEPAGAKAGRVAAMAEAYDAIFGEDPRLRQEKDGERIGIVSEAVKPTD